MNGGTTTRPAALDTVLIEPDAARVSLVWRAALECDKKVLQTREVVVDLVQAVPAMAI
jgi:hypothetical protein